MSQQADPEEERFATQERLGKLLCIYRPGWLVLVPGIVLIVSCFASIPAFFIIFPSIPGWAFLLTIVFWLFLFLLSIAIIRDHARSRRDRILLYEQGLIEKTAKGMQIIRWDQVRYIWRPVMENVGPSHPPTYTPYIIQSINGASFSFTTRIAHYDELVKRLDQRLMPLLLSRARERYRAGQEVAFHSLVLNKAGLRTKDRKKTLLWSEVVTVKGADTLKIRQRGKKWSWFADNVPNRPVCETLLNEILAEQSTQTPLEE